MNSRNNKTTDHLKLVLNLADIKDVKKSAKHVAFSNHSIYHTWKRVQH